MEDKRTLMAFLLIGLILLLMEPYYEWMGLSQESLERQVPETEQTDEVDGRAYPPEPQPAGEPQLTEPSVAPASRRAAVAPPPAEAQPESAFVSRLIRVRTPLLELAISTQGAVLTSVKPLGYEREVGEQVELVPAGERGLTLSLRAEGDGPDTARDLSMIEFVPDRESVRISEGEQTVLRLRAEFGAGRFIEKQFTFHGDRYGIDLDINYVGFDDRTVAWLGWPAGIAISERVAGVDLRAMRVAAFVNESLEEYRADEDEAQHWNEKGSLSWAGINNKYFFIGLAPRGDARQWVELTAGPSSETVPKFSYNVGSRMSNAGTLSFLLYTGPLDYEEVVRYETDMERALDLGYPIIREISKLLIVLFVATYPYIPNYGFVIILFAVVIKLLVYPLTHKSYESAAKMQKLQPKIAALKEKYKNDSQRLSRETMQLYKDEGVNPLGGCLPMLLQMPIFIAMYQTFSSTIELRQAPFVLWIHDLSLPDEILIAGVGVHVLPILMAGAMFFQSKMTMKDPKQAALVYIMPVVMVFIMWSFASGLVLYWTVFNVLQIGQQYLTNYMKEKADSAAAT